MLQTPPFPHSLFRLQFIHHSAQSLGGGDHVHLYMPEDRVREGVSHVLNHFDHLSGRKDFKDTDDLEKDLGLDSLDRMEFYKALEDEFFIDLSEEMVLDLQGRPLGDTVSYLRTVNVQV